MTPDIVITDIQMPQMDGLTMAKEILEMVPTVPIIVVTAFEQTDYLMQAINIGIEKYVTKPVNSYLLYEKLLECAHRLRAEELVRLQDIRKAWSKHNETIAIMAGGIAHDYNNMMQGILGYTALAKMHLEPGSEASNYLEKVENCSEEVNKLGRVLSILGSDFNGEKSQGQIMPCLMTAIKSALSGTTVSLDENCPEELPEILFDVVKMNSVFSGLATNAVEAMPTGGVLQLTTKTVEISEHDDLPVKPGNYIKISLKDSGTGIPPDLMQKIFAPYYSTKQRSTKRGMGLSLALCRTIIMAHSGSIAAESTPGQGTTFHIWLPTA